MPKPTETHRLAVLHRAAPPTPSSLNDKERTVEVVWTTGASVRRYSFLRDEVYEEELSLDAGHVRLDRLQSGRMPVLDRHASASWDSVLGRVEGGAVLDGQGTATLRFGTGTVTDRIWQMIREGIAVNVSVGYRVHRYEKSMRGDTRVMRAVDWEPLEISIVPVGADAGAYVRSAEGAESEFNDVEILDVDTQRAPAQTSEDPKMSDENPSGKKPEEHDDVARKAATEAVEHERARVTGIRDIGRKLGLGDDWVDDQVNGGVSLDRARTAAIDETAKRAESDTGGPGRIRAQNAIITADEVDRFRQGAVVGLLGRSIYSDIGERNEFTGMTLRELARLSLDMMGDKARYTDPLEMIGRAFTTSRAGGMHSTGDFPLILADVAHKSMLKGVEASAENFQMWTTPGNASDFKAHKRVDLESFSSLPTVPEHGEYQYATVGEYGATVILATYGRLFGITRQAIINDDLGAFTRVPGRMGQAAIRTVGDLVYAILTSNPTLADGVALFHANHGNLATAGSALSVASLDARRTAMGTQKLPGTTKSANIRPRYLLVPIALEGTAGQLMNSEADPTDNKSSRVTNKVRGMAEVISDGRLDDDSATAWYLSADGNLTDTIEVTYLNGQRNPTLEQQMGWRVDGVEFKVRMDAAATPLGHRGLQKATGAA